MEGERCGRQTHDARAVPLWGQAESANSSAADEERSVLKAQLQRLESKLKGKFQARGSLVVRF